MGAGYKRNRRKQRHATYPKEYKAGYSDKHKPRHRQGIQEADAEIIEVRSPTDAGVRVLYRAW